MKGRGPRPKPDDEVEFLKRLQTTFRWVNDPDARSSSADVTGWWRYPAVIAGLGPALARLIENERPEVILAPQSRGTLIGALVATHLGIGLVELRKEPGILADTDAWITARTPPDYRDRNLTLSARASLLDPGTRVLFVDDWVDTGGQLQAAHTITATVCAQWCGAAVVVDALSQPRLRHELKGRALLHIRPHHTASPWPGCTTRCRRPWTSC